MSEQTNQDLEYIELMQSRLGDLRREIHKAIVGQDQVIDAVLYTLFAQGHILLVGVPGLAKTLLIRTVSEALSLTFKRIQFVPDLMPSDITGTEIIQDNPETGAREMKFIQGPIFANIILADEINRANPKTQAAMLESMQEHTVSVGRETFKLEEPFFVLATQNPIEQEGTYPLPEAQLDRFLLNVYLDYPDTDSEIEIIERTTSDEQPQIKPVVTRDEIIKLQHLVRKVPASRHVVEYAVNIVKATRPEKPEATDFVKKYVGWGAGPRAGQALILASKARAIFRGRTAVSTEDIRAVAPFALRHRVLTNFYAKSDGVSSLDVVGRLIEAIPEPDYKR